VDFLPQALNRSLERFYDFLLVVLSVKELFQEIDLGLQGFDQVRQVVVILQNLVGAVMLLHLGRNLPQGFLVLR